MNETCDLNPRFWGLRLEFPLLLCENVRLDIAEYEGVVMYMSHVTYVNVTCDSKSCFCCVSTGRTWVLMCVSSTKRSFFSFWSIFICCARSCMQTGCVRLRVCVWERVWEICVCEREYLMCVSSTRRLFVSLWSVLMCCAYSCMQTVRERLRVCVWERVFEICVCERVFEMCELSTKRAFVSFWKYFHVLCSLLHSNSMCEVECVCVGESTRDVYVREYLICVIDEEVSFLLLKYLHLLCSLVHSKVVWACGREFEICECTRVVRESVLFFLKDVGWTKLLIQT